MKQITKVVFVADDGMEFDTEQKALARDTLVDLFAAYKKQFGLSWEGEDLESVFAWLLKTYTVSKIPPEHTSTFQGLKDSINGMNAYMVGVLLDRWEEEPISCLEQSRLQLLMLKEKINNHPLANKGESK